jgi:hypothetical protein
MSLPPAFPAPNSIPPPYLFLPSGGLAFWLNNNPTYKQYFWNTGYFPTLLPPNLVTSTVSSLGYEYDKVPLSSNLTTLSEYQARRYYQQLTLFHRVYSYNSNAYVQSIINNKTPIYYTFKDSQELTNYRTGVQVANKLSPFQVMQQASTLNWTTPFPVFI